MHLTFSFGSSGAALVAVLMQDTSAQMFARAPLHGCPGTEKYIPGSPHHNLAGPGPPLAQCQSCLAHQLLRIALLTGGLEAPAQFKHTLQRVLEG